VHNIKINAETSFFEFKEQGQLYEKSRKLIGTLELLFCTLKGTVL
jgi:hypothetical protein